MAKKPKLPVLRGWFVDAEMSQEVIDVRVARPRQVPDRSWQTTHADPWCRLMHRWYARCEKVTGCVLRTRTEVVAPDDAEEGYTYSVTEWFCKVTGEQVYPRYRDDPAQPQYLAGAKSFRGRIALEGDDPDLSREYSLQAKMEQARPVGEVSSVKVWDKMMEGCVLIEGVATSHNLLWSAPTVRVATVVGVGEVRIRLRRKGEK